MILSKRPEIERFLNAPPPETRAILIYGRDRGQVRERADAVAGKLTATPDDPFSNVLLTETDLEGDPVRLQDELQALSMTGGRRLVRVRLTGEKAGPDKICAEAFERHAEGAYNPEAALVVEGGDLRRESALRKAAEKAKAGVCVPCYEDETGDVARMVREALARDRLGLDGEAMSLFVGRLPKDRGVARAEIERLALYLGPGSGRTAGSEELQAYLGVEPEASLFDAAADAFGARAAQAQAGLRRAFAEGEGGPAAVRAAGLHLAKLRRVHALTASGAELKEATKAAGVFWKQEREFLRQLRAWTPRELDGVQPDLVEADRACKTSGRPDALIAERLILSIAMKARRLGL